MKKILFAIALMSATIAFAGPLDDINDVTKDIACTSTGNENPTGTYQANVGAGNLVGCLSAQTGLKAVDGDSTNANKGWETGTYIAWAVQQQGSGANSYYRYKYTFFGSDPPAISHFIIGVSDTCAGSTTSSTRGTNCIWNVQSTAGDLGSVEGPKDNAPSTQGNPGMPDDIYGIKVNVADDADPNPWTVMFDSVRVPVWQNFYAKGGNDTYAYNRGAWDTSNTSSSKYYIAAPDSVIDIDTDVPEPGFYGALALGIAGLFAAHRRRNVQG